MISHLKGEEQQILLLGVKKKEKIFVEFSFQKAVLMIQLLRKSSCLIPSLYGEMLEIIFKNKNHKIIINQIFFLHHQSSSGI